jgi:tRNA(Ile)-lysidine synthase
VPIPPPAPDLVARFREDIESLTGSAPALLGLAVSGGPDSLALLLLAHAAYPDAVRAATVDHRLRPEAAAEAELVAGICAEFGVPHSTLPAPAIAGSSIQARAREIRYQLLEDWLSGIGAALLATAHHLDDQAETLLMRLGRGSGVAGLTGVRPLRRLGMDSRLVRPLLGWRKEELIEVVRSAGLEPVDDPSNRSPDHDRTAARALLARAPWLDPQRLAASASHLADAEEALCWAEAREWDARARRDGAAVEIDTDGLPRELLRRLAARAVSEVRAAPTEWRRDKLAGALDLLARTGRVTVAEVQLTARGALIRFEPAPPRRPR